MQTILFPIKWGIGVKSPAVCFFQSCFSQRKTKRSFMTLKSSVWRPTSMKKMISSTRGVRSAYVSPRKGAFVIVVLTGAIQTKVFSRETEGAPCVVYQNVCSVTHFLKFALSFSKHIKAYSIQNYFPVGLMHVRNCAKKMQTHSYKKKLLHIVSVKLLTAYPQA